MEKGFQLVNKYVHSIKHENRFFVDDDVIKIFENIIEENKDIIKTGSILYRGRVLEDNREKPYGLDGYGIPSNDVTCNGRLNPFGINYLYTAENIETVVAELRPEINCNISIGTLRVETDIPIIEICNTATSDYSEIADFILLFSSIFTRHINAKNSMLEYIPMQYFAEFCKNKEIRGIRYLSSVNKDNYNVLLFDERCIKCIESKTISVKSISYKYEYK